jgi:L-2-hydroxyglutarate oxidase LhgO
MFESGIRAQLLDIKARKLEMDFVIEGDEKSTHILNAVSPGWTCAMPFAAYYCDQIARLSGHIKISFILMGLSGV